MGELSEGIKYIFLIWNWQAFWPANSQYPSKAYFAGVWKRVNIIKADSGQPISNNGRVSVVY